MSLIDLTAHEAHEKLISGEISSVELTKAYLDRIHEKEPLIKAFLSITEELAMTQAKNADRRIGEGENVTAITGIPVALKDLLCTDGIKTTCGSRILENFIPPYDATAVSLLKEAGAVFIGKTNMDEFAMGSSTENSAFQLTHNPWDTERVPGGSSGGSAAAVAAREAPLALGTDTGGSIRQPASFCGVSGIKPTYGSVSRYGLVAFGSSLDQIGPLAKDVKDLALCLDCIAGYDHKDSTSVNFTKPDYLKSLEDINIKGMKFGYPVNFFGEGLDEGVRKVLENARSIFESLGAEFVDVELPLLDYCLPAYYIIAPSEASSNLARYDGVRYGFRDPDDSDVDTMFKKSRRKGFGAEVIRRILVGTYALSAGYYDAYYLKAQKVRTLIKEDFNRAFEKCDIIFSPATPTTAFKIGEKTDDPVSMYLSDIYTVSANLAGIPGLVFPGGKSGSLPAGVQLFGKAFDEITLLKAGAAFQNTTNYHRELPE